MTALSIEVLKNVSDLEQYTSDAITAMEKNNVAAAATAIQQYERNRYRINGRSIAENFDSRIENVRQYLLKQKN